MVATPLFGRLSSAELCGQPSLLGLYSKLQSISLREFSSINPAVAHIPPIVKDDDPIAPPAAATQPYMPEEWPEFSKKKVDPDVRKKFFNRMEEYDMVMRHLNDEPIKPLLLLGPASSGKSVSCCHRQLSVDIVFSHSF